MLWQVLTILLVDAGMGKVDDGVGVLFSMLLVLCFLERLLVLLLVEQHTHMFSGSEIDFSDVERYATQFGGSAPAAETDFGGAQRVPGAGPSRSDPKCGQREVANVQRGAAASPCTIETDLENAQFDCAVAAPSGPPGSAGSFDVGGGDELPAAENNLSGTQFCGALAALLVPVCRAGSVGVRKGDARHLSRGALVAQRLRSGGGQRQGRRAVSGFVAGFGQQARCERAEAGSCLDSDVLLSCRVENPSARVARVNTALHQNSLSTLARSLHDVHVARCVQNSLNSLGDGVVLTEVEDIGVWPDGLLDAYVAMIPKADGDATPLVRDLSVCSQLCIVFGLLLLWVSKRVGLGA